MEHEELLSLSSNDDYAICREYITEALSFKLNRYENAIKENLKYNNPNFRVNQEPSQAELMMNKSVNVPGGFMDQSQGSI